MMTWKRSMLVWLLLVNHANQAWCLKTTSLLNNSIQPNERSVRGVNNGMTAVHVLVVCKYYEINENSLSWSESQTACESHAGGGGRLAVIGNQLLNARLSSLMVTRGLASIWIDVNGVSLPGGDSDSDTCIPFNPWENGNVPQSSTVCAAIFSDGTWQDSDCSQLMPSICQIDAIPDGIPDVPSCQTDTCNNNGVCQDQPGGGYVCICDADYEGDNCETSVDLCTPSLCQNGGECVHADGSCVCLNGFDGTYCENCIAETVEQTGTLTESTSISLPSDMMTSVKGITSFTLDGDFYIMACAPDGSGCRGYTLNGAAFTELPSTFFDDTSLAYGWYAEPFVIGSDQYIAIAINKVGIGSDSSSFILKWDGTKFILHSSFPPTSSGASHVHFLSTVHGDFLILSNLQSFSSAIVDSIIYKWDDGSNQFISFQAIQTNQATEAISFVADQNTYLLFAENLTPNLYKLSDDGTQFEIYATTVPFSQPMSYSKFWFQCKWHLVVNKDTASVYVWETDHFVLTTDEISNSFLFTSDGGSCTFVADDYPFVVTANTFLLAFHRPRISDLVVENINYVFLEPNQPTACCGFTYNGNTYLLLGNKPVAYQWS